MQKRYKLNNIADIYYFVIITKFNNNENNFSLSRRSVLAFDNKCDKNDLELLQDLLRTCCYQID